MNSLLINRFDTGERDENRELLDAFADDVEEINSIEGRTIIAVGFAGFMDLVTIGAAVTAFTSGGTLTPLFEEVAVATTGVNDAAAKMFYKLDRVCTSAHDNYKEVFKLK